MLNFFSPLVAIAPAAWRVQMHALWLTYWISFFLTLHRDQENLFVTPSFSGSKFESFVVIEQLQHLRPASSSHPLELVLIPRI
jgi:hypothetical protein